MRTILILLLLCSSCAVTFGTRPSAPPAPHVDCTSGDGLWVLDAIATAAAIGVGIYGGFVRSDSSGQYLAGGSFLTAVALLASAGNGYRWANECRRQEMRSVAAR